MKKIVLILFALLIIVAVSIFMMIQPRNRDLENRIAVLKESIKEQEIINEENVTKKQEFEELKEEKKVQVEKYEEVEAWNKEIMDYLQ